MSVVATIGNTWGGRMQEELLIYVHGQAKKSPIMAFQEVNLSPASHQGRPTYITNKRDQEKGLHSQVMINQFEMLNAEISWTHRGLFGAENVEDYACTSGVVHPNIEYGNALFVSHDIEVIEQHNLYILGDFNERLKNGSSPRVLQYVVFKKDAQLYLFAHFHGVWFIDENGSTKSDATIRIEQSANVLSALEKLAVKYQISKVVFGGDFNLDIDTVSLRMFEKGTIAGNMRYRNLIKEHGITNTRTPLYREHGKPGISMYADYVFVSPAVDVHSLKLIGEHVSDHLHIEIDFS